MSSILFDSMNNLYASEVVAKPSGTFIPRADKLLIISPRDAFFPPTLSISSKDISENLEMYFCFMAHKYLKTYLILFYIKKGQAKACPKKLPLIKRIEPLQLQ